MGISEGWEGERSGVKERGKKERRVEYDDEEEK